MVSAKDIIVKPIKSSAANDVVRRVHYSGKVVNNSSLHFGVFLNGKLEGAMSFGSPLDKRKVLPLVSGTAWTGMLELNRMAFSEVLPRNSESRAMSVAFRLIRKHYPHIEWILSFSDGTQSGDGAIYRASGFVLTAIKRNDQIWEAPNGERFARISLTDKKSEGAKSAARKAGGISGGTKSASSMKDYVEAGFKPLKGFQIRYVYFLNPEARSRLTVPILPFSKIDEMGAGMYRGIPKRVTKAISGDHPEGGGALPTHTLQSKEAV